MNLEDFDSVLDLKDMSPDFSPTTYKLQRHFEFPGGERHIQLPYIRSTGPLLVMTRLDSSNDLMDLFLVVDALRREGIHDISLYAPYIPYGRQDRVAVKGEPLSIAVMTALLGSMPFRHVYTIDPHSLVTTATLWTIETLPMRPFVYDVMRLVRTSWKYYAGNAGIVMVAPDVGAAKKIDEYSSYFREYVPTAYALKHRDPGTGELSFKDFTGDFVTGHIAVIFDDICDGGGTFIPLARELLSRGAVEVHLAVTHGIFSKGLQPLKDAGITRVYTTDSRIPILGDHEPKNFLHQYKILGDCV